MSSGEALRALLSVWCWSITFQFNFSFDFHLSIFYFQLWIFNAQFSILQFSIQCSNSDTLSRRGRSLAKQRVHELLALVRASSIPNFIAVVISSSKCSSFLHLSHVPGSRSGHSSQVLLCKECSFIWFLVLCLLTNPASVAPSRVPGCVLTLPAPNRAPYPQLYLLTIHLRVLTFVTPCGAALPGTRVFIPSSFTDSLFCFPNSAFSRCVPTICLAALMLPLSDFPFFVSAVFWDSQNCPFSGVRRFKVSASACCFAAFSSMIFLSSSLIFHLTGFPKAT